MSYWTSELDLSKGGFATQFHTPKSKISQFCAWMVICTNQHGLCSTIFIQSCRRAALFSSMTTEQSRPAKRLWTIFVPSNPYVPPYAKLTGQGSSGVNRPPCGQNCRRADWPVLFSFLY